MSKKTKANEKQLSVKKEMSENSVYRIGFGDVQVTLEFGDEGKLSIVRRNTMGMNMFHAYASEMTHDAIEAMRETIDIYDAYTKLNEGAK